MSLTELYYVCSVGIYYNVYRLKNNKTIQNGQRDVTVEHSSSDNEMAGNVMRVKKKPIISL